MAAVPRARGAGRLNAAPPMRSTSLLLDVSRLVWRGWGGQLPTGIDRTCLAYAAHYRARALAVLQWGQRTYVLSRQSSDRVFNALLNGGRVGNKAAIARALSIMLVPPPPLSVRGRLYLNIGHTGLDRIGHAGWVRRSGVRAVYFVHDLIPIDHPEHCRVGESDKHRARVRAMLNLGSGVIANSRDTLSLLTGFAEREGIAMPHSTLAAPLGVDAPWFSTAGLPLAPELAARPYFVVLGTIEGRKNHVLLLKLWRAMADAMGEACPRLVIVGRRGWQADEALALLDHDPGLRAHVTERSDCTDAELLGLLRGAEALLFPTLAEGYGLPLVEALALGTPVIASDLPVFREIAGDLPLYRDPKDLAGWREAVMGFSAASERARIQAAAFRAPTWGEHFAVVDRWLANLSVYALAASG